MRKDEKVALGTGLAPALALVVWKPPPFLLFVVFHLDPGTGAIERVDRDVVAYAQRVIEISPGPQGPSDEQLHQAGRAYVRSGDADELWGLTVKFSERYWPGFGSSVYQACRRIGFHDLGTPAAGYDVGITVDCVAIQLT